MKLAVGGREQKLLNPKEKQVPLMKGPGEKAKGFNFRELSKTMAEKGHIGNSPVPASKEKARKQIVAIMLSKAREKK